MNVIQTYQQGGRHKTNNQPCEDRTYSLSKNGVCVIALADGAGSSKYTHSADGAECVTKTISDFFCNNFDKFYEKNNNEELSAVIMAVCQRALQKKVEELGLDGISRLSSTLLCVAIKDEKVICCHIGDGVIGKLTPKGTTVVSAPDNGEFASTTYFITNPNADQYIHIIKEMLGDTLSYFLMSDGTSDYIYNKFDNSFYDAAKKMALMAIEDNGQTNLENTVKDYMVNKDAKSDDCSFVCLTIDVAEDMTDISLMATVNNGNESKDTTEESVKSEHNKEYDSNLSLLIENFEHKKVHNEDESCHSKSKKKRKSIIIVIAVLTIVITLFSSFISKKNNQKHKEEITISTTISTEESFANKSSTSTDNDMISGDTTESNTETTVTTSLNNVEDSNSTKDNDEQSTIKNGKETNDLLEKSATVKRRNISIKEQLLQKRGY